MNFAQPISHLLWVVHEAGFFSVAAFLNQRHKLLHYLVEVLVERPYLILVVFWVKFTEYFPSVVAVVAQHERSQLYLVFFRDLLRLVCYLKSLGVWILVPKFEELSSGVILHRLQVGIDNDVWINHFFQHFPGEINVATVHEYSANE